MKIAIPVDEKDIGTDVCMSFGRTPFYLFVDTQTKEHYFKANEAANASGGAGIQAAQMIVDEGAKAVLTQRCGENAAEVLTPANVKLYKATLPKAMDNVDALNNHQLVELTVSPGRHQH